MNNIKTVELQVAECKKHNVPFLECPYYMKVGLAKNFDIGHAPINGLRHPQRGNNRLVYMVGKGFFR